MVGWIVALISGVLMSIQGVLNTEVTKQTSLWVRMGTAVSVDCLYYSLVHQGQKQCDGIDGCQPEVYASWRCDRRVYHLDSDCQYGPAGADKSGAAHCGFTDSGGVSD